MKGLGRLKQFSGGGFSTVFKEDGGILCWRDPGGRDADVEWSAEQAA